MQAHIHMVYFNLPPCFLNYQKWQVVFPAFTHNVKKNINYHSMKAASAQDDDQHTHTNDSLNKGTSK